MKFLSFFMLFPFLSFAATQEITCAQSGHGFYLLKLELETNQRGITGADLRFNGEYLTPGLFSQSFGSSTAEGLKLFLAGGQYVMEGRNHSPASDDYETWIVRVPKTVLNKRLKKGSFSVFVDVDGGEYELDQCWSTLKQ